MCGICGILSVNSFDSQAVARMNQYLKHRGPDGEGFYKENGLELGMRRLSIIDLNSSWQPLFNEDQSIVLMINGEIYNYLELRESLIKKGHIFKTNGDGETIIHLYEEYGVNCLDYLRGMFAFALWDKSKKTLFIARDRMGEKPLYYNFENGTFIFSSEIRSLMASRLIKKELDPFSIDLYFHYHYVPEPHTPIKNVQKLPAGHYLLLDSDLKKVEEKCYWRMEDAPPLIGNPADLIAQKLNEVSCLTLRSDVPIAVALSGGIDSSIIAAYASKNYQGNLHAFTIGYEGRPESDERSDAAKIAKHLEIPFHEIELTNLDFVDNFPKMCYLTDDPIADISAFGYYSVSRAAKENGIPVMLQGQGGDELFWGYPWVRKNYEYVKLKQNRANISRYYFNVFKERYTAHNIKKLIKAAISIPEAYKLMNKHLNEDDNIFPFYDYYPAFDYHFHEIYGDFMNNHQVKYNAKAPFILSKPWGNPEISLTKLISETYLLENGMAQGDRLSMANSVELRLPLVDYQFVETVIGLRKNYSDIQLKPKSWLIDSSKQLLPEWLFEKRKRGFEPPVQLWLNSLLEKYGQKLPEGELVTRGILNKKTAYEFSKGRISPQIVFPAFFSALVLEFWIESVFKEN